MEAVNMVAQTRVVETILVTVPLVTNIPLVLKPPAQVRAYSHRVKAEAKAKKTIEK